MDLEGVRRAVPYNVVKTSHFEGSQNEQAGILLILAVSCSFHVPAICGVLASLETRMRGSTAHSLLMKGYSTIIVVPHIAMSARAITHMRLFPALVAPTTQLKIFFAYTQSFADRRIATDDLKESSSTTKKLKQQNDLPTVHQQ